MSASAASAATRVTSGSAVNPPSESTNATRRPRSAPCAVPDTSAGSNGAGLRQRRGIAQRGAGHDVEVPAAASRGVRTMGPRTGVSEELNGPGPRPMSP